MRKGRSRGSAAASFMRAFPAGVLRSIVFVQEPIAILAGSKKTDGLVNQPVCDARILRQQSGQLAVACTPGLPLLFQQQAGGDARLAPTLAFATERRFHTITVDSFILQLSPPRNARLNRRQESITSSKAEYLSPLAQSLDVRRRAVAQPAVELRRILQLLAAQARHDDEARIYLRQCRHVAPELLELRHGEDILLPVAPAFLDLFECDIGRHFRGQRADGGG